MTSFEATLPQTAVSISFDAKSGLGSSAERSEGTDGAATDTGMAALLGNDTVLAIPTVPDIAPLRDADPKATEDFRARALTLFPSECRADEIGQTFENVDADRPFAAWFSGHRPPCDHDLPPSRNHIDVRGVTAGAPRG